VLISLRGKAYPNVVGEVLAHQVPMHRDHRTHCLNSRDELVRRHPEK